MASVKDAFGCLCTGMVEEHALCSPVEEVHGGHKISTMYPADDGEYSPQRGKASESGGYQEPMDLLHILLSANLLYTNTRLSPVF